MLGDYGPEAWGAVVAQAVVTLRPTAIVATGTDRGNEVLAHVAARLDLPMVANCTEFTDGDVFHVTRVRWGGSLLEEAAVGGSPVLFTVAHHAIDARPADAPGAAEAHPFEPDLDPSLCSQRGRRPCRTSRRITLSTAPVVVGGGRGSGPPTASHHCRNWPTCSAVSSGVHVPSPTTAGATTPTRSARRGTWIAPDIYFGVRHFGRDPLGRCDGVEEHLGHQHRPQRQHGHQGRLCRDRRLARGRSGHLDRDPQAPWARLISARRREGRGRPCRRARGSPRVRTGGVTPRTSR